MSKIHFQAALLALAMTSTAFAEPVASPAKTYWESVRDYARTYRENFKKNGIKYWEINEEKLDAAKRADIGRRGLNAGARANLPNGGWALVERDYLKSLQNLATAQIRLEEKALKGGDLSRLTRSVKLARRNLDVAISEVMQTVGDRNMMRMPFFLHRNGVIAALAAVGLGPKIMDSLNGSSESSQMISNSSSRIVLTEPALNSGAAQQSSKKAN
jgi:hypothetical protein